jgi:hypothetical protein
MRVFRRPTDGQEFAADFLARRFFLAGQSVASLATRYSVRAALIEDILRWYLQPENAKALQEARGR